MAKLLAPHDLGSFSVVENCTRVSVNEITEQYLKAWKQSLMKEPVIIGHSKVRLTASTPRWGGLRLWFTCPLCRKRRGVLFMHPLSQQIGCRGCLGLKYKAQRYKGMVENNLVPYGSGDATAIRN